MIPRVLTLSATLAALTAMLATPALAGNEKGRAYPGAAPPGGGTELRLKMPAYFRVG